MRRQRGWEIVTEFVDAAESATTDDRPQFRDMISAARLKPAPFDFILVWKFSRFSRNREDSVLYKRMLERNGVRVVSLNEPVDDSPAGRMLEAILESVDEFYSQNLAQDISRGLRKNASMGYSNGGPPPLGYRRRRTGTAEGAPRNVLEPDPQWAPFVQRIFRMALAGEGVTTIASALNTEGVLTPRGCKLSNTAVHKLLTNEVYTGTLIWGTKRTGLQQHKAPDPIRVEDAHEGLVSREDFEQVQRLLAARAPAIVSANTLANDYLLGGMIHCTACGGIFVGHNARSGAYRYYACQSKKKRGAGACTAKPLPKAETEAAVISVLRDELLSPSYIKQLVELVNEEANTGSAAARAEVEAATAQLNDAKRKLDNLYRAIEDGGIELSVLAPRIRTVKAQVDDLTTARDALVTAGTPVLRLADEATIGRYVARLHQTLATGSANAQRTILRAWVARIDARGTDLTVTFTLPPDVGTEPNRDKPMNKGQNSSMTEVLPRVVNGGGGGSRTRVRDKKVLATTCVAPGSQPPSGPGTHPERRLVANLRGYLSSPAVTPA